MADSRKVRLIVNADDFGMTKGVNRAVAELYDAGALTSATLMAQGGAFDDAVRLVRERPALGVGCHIVLVDGRPSAQPEEIPSVLLPGEMFSTSMAHFAVSVQMHSIQLEHIQFETAAQIAKLQDAGVNVTHVDTHKHTHMLPRVSRAVMLGALSRGVRRIRNPFEPAWCAALSPAPLSRRLPFRLLHKLQGSFARLCKELGMVTTDASLGLIATGSLDAATLQTLLDATLSGTYELVCHPGYNDAELDRVNTKLRTSRDAERTSLLQVIPRLSPEKFHLISYAETQTSPSAGTVT